MLLMLVCSSPLTLPGQAAGPPVNPDLLSRVWDAQWISHPTAPRDAFGVFHFRRSFDLKDKPATFVINVSADNRYRLFVNSAPVSSGPARSDLAHWRFETVDIVPHLRAGKNVIAAVVWNYAEHRPVAQVSHQTAFLLQGNSEGEAVVNTGPSWKVVQNRAYTPIPVDRAALGHVYIVVGPGEQMDANLYPWGWAAPDFSDRSWLPALPLGRAVPKWGHHHDIHRAWKLVPRTIPPLEETLQRLARVARADGIELDEAFLGGAGDLVIPRRSKVTLLLDQGRLTTAYPEMIITGGKGGSIKITYAEALVDAEGRKGNRNEIAGKTIRGYTDRFIPDGGDRRTLRTLWFRTYRYLQLEIETDRQALTIHDLYGIFTAYPFKEQAAFASSDPSLKAIWDVGWWTARLCAGETYFDCPYYEQLQYAGDTRIQALISLHVSGDDRLMRKAIQAFNDSRIPEGLTESRYPTMEPQYIPPYSLFWIAMVHDYWRYRDDPEFVSQFLTGIRGVIDWYEGYIADNGMLGPMPWWNFVDWSYPRGVPPGADDGHSAVITLQYVYVLRYAAELAAAFNRPDEAAHYRTVAAALKTATYRECWDASRDLLADTPKKVDFSQHANVMAVLVDLIPHDRERDLMERVAGDTSLVPCTYYYRFYLDRAMQKVGLGDGYLQRLGPWREMLALGLTTFAEEPEPTRSDCHAWSASPNYYFLATVCGIEPAQPGFKSVRIAPALGALEWVEGRMPHPRGDILVSLKRRGKDGIQGEITLPATLRGTFLWQGQEVLLVSGTQKIYL